MKETNKNFSEIAIELEWYHDKQKKWGDSQRVKRAIGLSQDYSHNKEYYRKYMGEDLALRFIKLMNRAPREFDL